MRTGNTADDSAHTFASFVIIERFRGRRDAGCGFTLRVKLPRQASIFLLDHAIVSAEHSSEHDVEYHQRAQEHQRPQEDVGEHHVHR